ncbi:hypothetical protein GTW25_09025 [Aliihoeflea aestuarii]|uniref:hypothetical protein n=1 Tax=Aliihoeflea aestuarii TaxID=453840 RepID=UPI00209325C5|nr:hypothetical protein [Aliihoeflea aestuarii]MCO6391168.1 hypothetical protein [Aliihoeflea aestuarii]
MNDSPKPPPRRGLERRSLMIVAIIVAVALAIFLFSTDDTPVPDVQSGGPGGEMTADPQPVPQLPPESETPQEPAN